MPRMPNTDFHFKKTTAVLTGCLCLMLANVGCINYRIVREVEGDKIQDPAARFAAGVSTMDEVLRQLGAPKEVISIQNKDLLVYQRALLYENRLSFGIPLLDIAFGGNADISAYGGLKRYDTLTFFFDTKGVLDAMVFEKGSETPYFRTLFSQ